MITQQKARRQEYNNQFQEIRRAETELQEHPHDREVQSRLDVAQQKLQELMLEKLEAVEEAATIQWNRIGDPCSREFFEFHMDYRRKFAIQELVVEGRSLTSETSIMDHVEEFYKNLYKAEFDKERDAHAHDICFRSAGRAI